MLAGVSRSELHLEQAGKEGLSTASEVVLPGSDICLVMKGLWTVSPLLQVPSLRAMHSM